MSRKLKQNSHVEARGYESCKKVLGSSQRVLELGLIYEQYKDDLELACESSLLNFCETENFTSEEYKAYKKGLTSLGSFLQACANEKDLYKTQGIDEKD